MTQRQGPWPSAFRRHAASACRGVVRAGIPIIILAAPLWFGAVGQAAVTSLLTMTIVVSVALIAGRALDRSDGPLVLGTPGLLGMVFLGLVLVQLVPLPPGMLSLVSPAADRHYAATVPGYGGEADALLALERATIPEAALLPPPSSPMRTVSLDPHASLAALPRTLLCLLLFLLAASASATGSMLRPIIVSLVLVSTFEAGYGLLEYLSGHQHIFGYQKTFDTGSVTGTYINRNHFAGLIELGLPAGLGLALSLRRGRPVGRRSLREVFVDLGSSRGARIVLIVLACSIMSAGLLLSFSRSGILVGMLGSVLAVFLAGRPANASSRALILFLVMAAAATPVYIAGSARLMERYEAIPSDIDTEGRLPVWKRTIEIAGAFPLTGTGHGTFATVFPAYRPPRTGFYDHAHNDYLQLMAEDGLPGLLLVMTALGACLLTSWRARKDCPRDQLDLSAGLLAGMAALMAHGLIDFNGQIPANAALFACAAGALYGSAASPASFPAGPRRILAATGIVASFAILTGLTWSVHGQEAATLRSIRAELSEDDRVSAERVAKGLDRLGNPADRRFPDPEALALYSRYSLLDGQSEAMDDPESALAGSRVHDAYRSARQGMIRQPTEAEHFLLAALAFQTAEVFGYLLPGQGVGSPWTEALVDHLLARASRLDPRNPTRRQSIGTIYLARGRIDLGIEEYRASLEAGDQHSKQILSAVWELPGGEALLERVSPPTPRGRLNLASFHGKDGRTRMAESIYRELLDAPEHKTVLAAASGLVRILLTEGRLDEGDSICASVARRFPENQDRLGYLRGQIARRSGRLSEAVGYFESALRLNPASPSVQWHLAEALCERSDHQACVAHMKRLLSGADLSRARELSARLLLADALEHQGRREESLEQYLRARILDPDNPEILEAIRRLDRSRSQGRITQ